MAFSLCFVWQPGFNPSDVPFRKIRTLGKHILEDMLPGQDVAKLDLHEPSDGDQAVVFYYSSMMANIKRRLADPLFAGKQYKQFEVEFSSQSKRIFRRVNSGAVFEYFQLQVPHASPVVFVLASDASFSGKHRGHHPIYRKFMLFLSVNIIFSV